ncbi:MAG: hypothetical protein ACPGYT_06920 [Nitrospirales bacterium]
MNTPAHLLINLLALGRKERPPEQMAILGGAILPDAPMFLFYFIEKVVREVPESLIWSHDYYLAPWQNFIDSFNSLPLIGLGLLFTWKMRSRAGQLLFLSMVLHVFGDLPLHHDDAHRHFFPLSDWRFESPISYWDPSHYGNIVTGLEVLAVLVCAGLLFCSTKYLVTKWVVGGIGLSYVIFFGYALWMWI